MRELEEYHCNGPACGVYYVELVFMVKDFSVRYLKRGFGKAAGMGMLKSAVNDVYCTLPREKGIVGITMENRKHSIVMLRDQEHRGIQWLEDMLVSARIVEGEESENGVELAV